MHLLFCNCDPSFDDFPFLTLGNFTFLLEIKESLLIKRGKQILNKKLVPLYYFYLTRYNVIE